MAGLSGLLACLVLQAPAPAPGRGPEGLVEIGNALAGAARGEGEAVERILAIGPPAAAAILEALGLDQLPAEDGPFSPGEPERAVLLECARRLGRSSFVPLLPGAVAAPETCRRLAAIELVGVLGSASDLRLAVLAAAGRGEPPAPAALEALERATDALLRRDPAALATVRSEITAAEPVLGGRLVRSVGSVGGAPALQVLGALLGAEALDLPLLSQIARVARGLAPPFDETLCAQVRRYLDGEDRQLVRAAAMALVELQDPEALPELVSLSSSPDPVLSGAAFAALERTTGLALPRRSERWQSWLSAEVAWTRERGAPLRSALHGKDPVRVTAALRELAMHRIDRPALVELAAGSLSHDDERVRAEACRTLGALGSPLAAPDLRRALSGPSPLVAAAALQTLRDLGLEP